MLWAAKIANSKLGRLIQLIVLICTFANFGLFGFPIFLFILVPFYFWAKEKVERHKKLNPSKPELPQKKTTITRKKPVPITRMLLTKNRSKQARGSMANHYADQLETLPLPLMELVCQGFSED